MVHAKSKKDYFMIGLTIAIITFNLTAFLTNKKLSRSQIVHIWMFTIAFQQTFDIFVEFKYHGYWYFGKGIDWKGLLPHLFIVPPVNLMFLNWYPSEKKHFIRFMYIFIFVGFILLYEAITLIPEPWGYFHNGWWKLWLSAIVDPILLLILLFYYNWICKLEQNKQCIVMDK